MTQREINKNIRCIEIDVELTDGAYGSLINKNIRCIEIRPGPSDYAYASADK